VTEPCVLTLVRHGESIGNVAREAAEGNSAEVIAVQYRDADVPLSPLGQDQSRALGEWLASLAPAEQPQHIWSSNYLRAWQTADIARAVAGLGARILTDERLRDRELGILDRLTRRGVEARYPQEAERKRWLGKMYYRPPGGESWADVALRLRSALAEIDRLDQPWRVMLVAHEAVVLLARYVCEHLDEGQLMQIARVGPVGNASVTILTRQPGESLFTVEVFNYQEHLLAAGSVPTQHPGDHDVSVP
jgi:broad specificity phosphatase PhoE